MTEEKHVALTPRRSPERGIAIRRLLRPWPLLLAAYLAATVGLAFTLPPRPSAEFTDKDTPYLFLIGFSPDGRRVATAPAPFDFTSTGTGLNKAPIRVRDLTSFFGSNPFLQLPANEENYGFAIRDRANAAFWRHFDDPTFARRLADLGLARPDTLEPRWLELSHDGSHCVAWFANADDPRPMNTGDAAAGLGVWNMATGQCRIAIAPKPNEWDIVADGAILTTLDDDVGPSDCSRFRAWDIATGRLLWESAWFGPFHQTVRTGPDGRWQAECEPASERWFLRDTTTGIAQPWFNGPITPCLFVRGGRAMAINGPVRDPSGAFRIVDRESGREIFVDPRTLDGEMYTQAASPDGASFAVSAFRNSDAVGVPSWFDGVREFLGLKPPRAWVETLLIDADDGTVLARLPGASMRSGLFDRDGPARCVVFSADGLRMAVAEEDRQTVATSTVRVWDLPIGRPWAFSALVAMVPALAFAVMIGTWKLARRRTTRR